MQKKKQKTKAKMQRRSSKRKKIQYIILFGNRYYVSEAKIHKFKCFYSEHSRFVVFLSVLGSCGYSMSRIKLICSKFDVVEMFTTSRRNNLLKRNISWCFFIISAHNESSGNIKIKFSKTVHLEQRIGQATERTNPVW